MRRASSRGVTRLKANIGSQVANWLANYIAVLHIKTQVVSHEAKEEVHGKWYSRQTRHSHT